MLFEGTHHQTAAVLEAMCLVATGDGRHPLSEADRSALVAAHHVIFGGHGELDVDSLGPITPVELATALGSDRERAEHALGFLTVMATVDGMVDDNRIWVVVRFAHALSLDPPYVEDLAELARGKLAEARADMVRRNLKSITGRWMGDDIDDWIMPYGDAPDPDLAARYNALGRLPEGTFGRAFHEFYLDNGFAFAGAPDAANEAFTTPHDSAHVLSGYDTSPQGELLVSTFTAGMHSDEPVTGHILPVIVSWHLGIELVEFAGSTTGKLDPPKFWRAWERGDELVEDTFEPSWDFWARVDQPLDDLRHEMGVPPLDPADAADGHYPDWYEPSA